MIKLTKFPKPKVLVDNADQWTTELMSYVNSEQKIPDSVKNRYNHPEIKEVLTNETRGKCMYCEGYIGAVSFSHIEHFRPKSIYPKQTFEWENLGLACQVCNTNKKDKFDETLPFINPYQDNPDDYFIFLGTMILQKPGCARAENMKNQLRLNRVELLEQRSEAIEKVMNLVERYNSATSDSIKTMLRKNIEIELEPDKQFSRCVKSVVEQMTNEKW